jgi:pimeloyl-ACP methyl ester carboxylesterase
MSTKRLLADDGVSTRALRSKSGHAIAAWDAGPRDAPACVFVHGIAQSKGVFERVLRGPLAEERRLVAFDLRGHGDSGVPEDAREIARAALAEDLDAVIRGLDLDRPTVVAWSFGGVVVGEYLRAHGDGALGAIVLLAASVRTGRGARELFGSVMLDHARALLAEEPGTYEEGARAFVRGCTAAPLDPALTDATAREMLRVAARVRRPLLAGGEDYVPDFLRARVPIATMHGELDRVVAPAMSALLADRAVAVRFSGAGHMPWLEAPEMFADALRRFSALARGAV